MLLPLPLVLLVLSLRFPECWESRTRTSHVSPVLEFEERMRLDSYRRDCRSRSDCEPPLGCLEDLRARTVYCTDSQCTVDHQCPEGQLCRSLPTRGGGPLVRLCTPVGDRQEGEQCDYVPPDKDSACGAGLLCGGGGWCARPCQTQDSATHCPAGFFCADVAPEPVCLPTCQGRRCPEGQQCVRHKDGVSSCVRVYGLYCQDDTSCAECAVSTFPQHPGEVWMQCVQRCGEDLPPCPEGSACNISRCAPICDREAPDSSCPEGFYCAPSWDGQPPVCEPDWKRRK